MPLVILTGLPCSGKTYRAQQIVADLESLIADDTSRKRKIQVVNSHHASLDTQYTSATESYNDFRDRIYNSAAQEKVARAEESSRIKRALSKDNIVVADGLNYIKGYRYQLWCEAKAAGTRCCVVHIAAQDEECSQWNEERIRVFQREEEVHKQNERKSQPTRGSMQGKDTLGNLVPESHTAIYGDRNARETDGSRIHSAKADLERGNGIAQHFKDDDITTLKSLYITDHSTTKGSEQPALNNPHHDLSNATSNTIPGPPAAATISIPPSTSAPPYSPQTLASLLMRYEPPSPFSKWDTPLFVIPSTDLYPPSAEIYAAIFPTSIKQMSKKALSQMYGKPAAAEESVGQESSKTTLESNEVKPHAATVLPTATSANALQTLESATMDVVRAILAAVKAKQETQTSSHSTSSIGTGNNIGIGSYSSPAATTRKTEDEEQIRGEEDADIESEHESENIISFTLPDPTTGIPIEIKNLPLPSDTAAATVPSTGMISASTGGGGGSTTSAISQPMLQRLRRKYTQIQRGGIAHGQQYVGSQGGGRREVVEGFLRFLRAEWGFGLE